MDWVAILSTDHVYLFIFDLICQLCGPSFDIFTHPLEQTGNTSAGSLPRHSDKTGFEHFKTLIKKYFGENIYLYICIYIYI